MTRPPDRPGAAQLRAALHELAAVEQWARWLRDGGGVDGGGGGPDGYGVHEEPVGPLLRVETMSGSGMHRVIAVGPAANHDEAQVVAARSVVRALLDLAGHQEGPATTEVALTARGPRIVACRLGGEAGGPAG
ncbi:hypothetical protein ACIGXM_12425 [Kitasatospora sp. NPDC052896]|uniref:hypothetical protein n=1 Tax=Kitasatospora sp. NPDC052896 TaxID=3364061 RepID=UPI0037CBE472